MAFTPYTFDNQPQPLHNSISNKSNKAAVAISNLSYVVSGSLLALIPNFIQVGQKTQKFKVIVGFGWSSWYVKKRSQAFQTHSFLFCSIFSPHTKFHPNRTKKAEFRNFHFWSILVGQAGRSKNGCRHIKLILCRFCPIISPHTKFHPNRTKNTEVRNFHFWSILVGRAGR